MNSSYLLYLLFVVLVYTASGLLYFSLCGRGYGATGDRKLFSKLTRAEDFDRERRAFAGAHYAALAQGGGAYRIAGGKSALKHIEVDHLGAHAKGAKGVSAQFGELFELFADVGADAVAGAGLLALGAAPCGLALAGGAAAADAL